MVALEARLPTDRIILIDFGAAFYQIALANRDQAPFPGPVEGTPLPRGGLFVSVCPFLVRTPADVLLLDAGLGAWAEGRSVATYQGVLVEGMHVDEAQETLALWETTRADQPLA